MNNCKNCGASYSTYKTGKNESNDYYEEYWCEVSNPKVETKGLCQFCNPKSKFYNK